MDRQIKLAPLYKAARQTVEGLVYREGPASPMPDECPVGLRDVLPSGEEVHARVDVLTEKFRAAT